MKKTVKKYVAQNVAQKPANPHSRAILTQLPKLNTRVRFPSPAPSIYSTLSILINEFDHVSKAT